VGPRIAFAVLRLVVLGVGVVALVGDFDYVLGFSSFATGNWFSYFTTQSAFVLDVTLAIGVLSALRRAEDRPWFVALRIVATTYAITSGAVFAVIVAQAAKHDYTVDVPWSSQLLHFWIPAYALLDWMLAPGRTAARWRLLPWVLAMPGVWAAFTLIRGPLVGWYPYFFLDPAQVSGPLEQAFYLALVGVILLAISGLFVLSSARPVPTLTGARARTARARRRLTARARSRRAARLPGGVSPDRGQ
jgi:hypothetical protein